MECCFQAGDDVSQTSKIPMTVALPADVYYALHEMRLARSRGDSRRLPPIGELVREALTAYVRDAREPAEKTEAHNVEAGGPGQLDVTTSTTTR
jgi:hypothetical protein